MAHPGHTSLQLMLLMPLLVALIMVTDMHSPLGLVSSACQTRKSYMKLVRTRRLATVAYRVGSGYGRVLKSGAGTYSAYYEVLNLRGGRCSYTAVERLRVLRLPLHFYNNRHCIRGIPRTYQRGMPRRAL
eukprot:SAG31_NODE_21540_length_546_cov_40.013423_1_plen_129_part_01